MASPTRSWHKIPSPPQAELERAIEQSMERSQSWMIPFVTSQLNSSVSPYDFWERIVQYVTSRWQGSLDPNRVDGAVRKAFEQLVHDERRNEFRRSQKFQTTPEIENVSDPRSLHFASQLERASQMALIREYLQNERPNYQSMVDQLFGFHEEEVSLDILAKRLGIRKNTLQHRLYRLYTELRSRLSRIPRQS
jgi:hypothetical protein